MLIRWVPNLKVGLHGAKVLFGMFTSSCCDPPAMLTKTVMTSRNLEHEVDGQKKKKKVMVTCKKTGRTISPANYQSTINITSNSDQRREGPTAGIGHFGGWCTLQVAKSDTHIHNFLSCEPRWDVMDRQLSQRKKERNKGKEEKKKMIIPASQHRL